MSIEFSRNPSEPELSPGAQQSRDIYNWFTLLVEMDRQNPGIMLPLRPRDAEGETDVLLRPDPESSEQHEGGRRVLRGIVPKRFDGNRYMHELIVTATYDGSKFTPPNARWHIGLSKRELSVEAVPCPVPAKSQAMYMDAIAGAVRQSREGGGIQRTPYVIERRHSFGQRLVAALARRGL